jgi:hypothetical protein
MLSIRLSIELSVLVFLYIHFFGVSFQFMFQLCTCSDLHSLNIITVAYL